MIKSEVFGRSRSTDVRVRGVGAARLSSSERKRKRHRRSIDDDSERRKRDGFKMLLLEGIYGYVAVKHGNSRNMADISNDYHLRHHVRVRVGIAFFGMP